MASPTVNMMVIHLGISGQADEAGEERAEKATISRREPYLFARTNLPPEGVA